MIAFLRGMLRALLFIAWTLGLGAVWLGLRVLLSPAKQLRGGARVLHVWSRGLCFLLGIRVTVEGEVLRGPALRVSNHRGYLDIIVLAATAPALFVSKDDLATWPVLGVLGKSLGTIFLDRTRARGVADAGARMSAVFAAGESVIVFPEGTSTDGGEDGATLTPFHSSLFEPALRAPGGGVPVQPVALDYRAGRALATWTGDATFLPHFWKLLKTRGPRVIDVNVVYGTAVTDTSDRRAAAAAARAWIMETLRAASKQDTQNVGAARSAKQTVGESEKSAAPAALKIRAPKNNALSRAPLYVVFGEPAPHGFGDAARLVRDGVHEGRRVRDGHRAPGLAEQGQVVGRVADGDGARRA
jgi:1-acyl-sn-glycerol-3-phosphate acyltransferase